MNEDKSNDLAHRQGISPNLVDAVRDVLAGKKPEVANVDEMEDAVELKKDLETTEEGLDPVNKKELKGKHKNRKDKDIDNDGDVDSTDKYLHKRRKAVSKAIDEAACKKGACVDEDDNGKCDKCGAEMNEGAQMVRGPDGQMKYKTSRMPLSLQRMARRKRPLAKRVMRSKIQVNNFDPTDVEEGAMSRIATQSAEKKRLGADKVKGTGLDTFKKKPAKDTLIANPRNQKVRKVTPSRAKMAVKKGFVYAEHMEGLEEADMMKGQPVGVSVTMKNKAGKKVKTSFPGTHSAVAGAKSHIGQMQKKGYTVHSKDLMYGKNEASEEVNEARRGRPSKSPVASNQDTETRHNIIHQLRKSVSLRGQHKVEFKDGKQHKISAGHASQALNKYNTLRTTGEKSNYQKQLHHSHDSFHTARGSKTPGAAPKKPGVSLGGGSAIQRAMKKD